MADEGTLEKMGQDIMTTAVEWIPDWLFNNRGKEPVSNPEYITSFSVTDLFFWHLLIH